MRHETFFHICHAAVLIVAMLAVMAGGSLLAKPSDGPAATSLSQQTGEASFTSGEGNGSEPTPAAKSSHTDYNPSCDDSPIILSYRPGLSALVPFEPFTAVPQVFPDRFVPPQNIA